jgi:hypothetical protein
LAATADPGRVRLVACSVAAFLALAAPALAQPSNGGTAPVDSASSGGSTPSKGAKNPAPGPAPAAAAPAAGAVATIVDGLARSPAGSPAAVRSALRAGNKLQGFPYRYGGGHEDFVDTAYDCSGTVSFALHGARLLDEPLDSTSFMEWGDEGPGAWITIYANPDHAYMVVAGLRLDTSAVDDPDGESGPRWRAAPRDPDGFVARHPVGL